MRLYYLCIVLVAVLGVSLGSIKNGEPIVSDSKEVEENPSQAKNAVSQSQSGNSNDADVDTAIRDEENAETEEKEKRFGFGSVLGKGFTTGKRFGNVLGHGMSFGKRFGSVLGNGMSFGKRFGTVLGNGMSFGKRYGSLLGKGYSFGKRGHTGLDISNQGKEVSDQMLFSELEDRRSANKRDEDDSIGEDIEIVDLVGPIDEKRWVLNDIYGGGFPSYKRSKRDTRTKRFFHYFGNMLGRGFSMGKKKDKLPIGSQQDTSDSDESPFMDTSIGDSDLLAIETKNMFGRPQRSFDVDRRPFGSVLGRGFTFGKRDFNLDSELENGFDDSVVDTNGVELTPGENGMEPYNFKRYFLSSPGYRFGKRDVDERNKRFGFILGRGFFGKRLAFPPKRKRPYGFVLGRGYSFGKRSPEYTEEAEQAAAIQALPDFGNTDQDLNKRPSFVLGRGYTFGKRGNKRFGWVLGNGFTFGKRDGTMENDQETASLFLDNFGSVFVRIDLIEDFDRFESVYLDKTTPRVFSCVSDLVLHHTDNPEQFQKALNDKSDPEESKEHPDVQEVRYFMDAAGYIYVKADDISGDDAALVGTTTDINYYTCDGYLLEILDSENISKREWGSILGRGFRFGKRKGFGHILGNGLSFSW